MARIPGVEDREAGPLVRLAYWLARRRLGRVPEPMRIMARAPAILRAAGAFEMSLERARRVDARLKSLAQVKAASLIGCVF